MNTDFNGRDESPKFDFVIIGSGGAGEAAAHLAAKRGAKVAVIERELIGGSCPFWACMPSKTLLHDARLHALAGTSWDTASERRDYMINRQGTDWPDDTGHQRSLEAEGVVVVRGDARISGRGRVRVAGADGNSLELAARNVVVAVGSQTSIPDLEGLANIRAWTNREATSARELPHSLVILGGGPTGIELAQVYARFGVLVTLVHPHDRLNQRDHPRNSAAIADTLERDGVVLALGTQALRVIPAGRQGGQHTIELSSGARLKGEQLLLATGRTSPLTGLGLENAGVKLVGGKLRGDGHLELVPGTWVVGDPAGPEMHTHLAHYQGELAVRMALGDKVAPDYRAIPRAVYIDPEVASVGMTSEMATAAGLEPLELTQDLAITAKGYVSDAKGHVTIVVDRAKGELLGAFIAGPGAAEAIHEAVLAIKARIPVSVLADTLHAFPTTARVLGGLFAQACQAIDTKRVVEPELAAAAEI